MIQFATFKQACEWFEAQSGSGCCDLPCLVGVGLDPLFWRDPTPDEDHQGYWARIAFPNGERVLNVSGAYVLVEHFVGLDGELAMVRPWIPVQIANLRFVWAELMALQQPGVNRVATVPPDFAAQTSELEGPAPALAHVKPQIDYALLATKESLIDAFGPLTGMNASWFKKMADAPALLAARVVKGKGGRPSRPAMFDPFKVMLWLIDPTRRKVGAKIRPATGWRLLEAHFPRVYNVHSVGDPRTE